jgi:hypothetical protein
LQCFEDFNCDWLIDTRAGEGNAVAHHLPAAISLAKVVLQEAVAIAVRVGHMERSAATGIGQQSSQQCRAAASGATGIGHAGIPAGVRSDLFLVAHEIFPRNIPLVMIGDDGLPLSLWADMASSLVCSAIDDRSARVLPAPDEDAGVGRVLQDAEVPG